jgi:hypothetical protein
MAKRIRYTDEPIGPIRIVEDFLPPPSELALREETEKVTIALSKRSVDFFRREARRNGTQYQRMIRALLDRYAQLHAPSDNRVGRTRGR